LVAVRTNVTARAIAKSVTREGQIQFYMGLRKPVWFHIQVVDEVR